MWKEHSTDFYKRDVYDVVSEQTDALWRLAVPWPNMLRDPAWDRSLLKLERQPSSCIVVEIVGTF